jgi:hypothetical protein
MISQSSFLALATSVTVPTTALVVSTYAPNVINIPSLQTSDIEIRSTIVFGVFGILLSTIGIIIAGLTFYIMYRGHRERQRMEGRMNFNDDLEMQTTHQHSLSRGTTLRNNTQSDGMDEQDERPNQSMPDTCEDLCDK